MLPVNKVGEVLSGYQKMMYDQFEELINATNLWAQRPNSIQKEDNGYYSVIAQGSKSQVIETLKQQLLKLESGDKVAND